MKPIGQMPRLLTCKGAHTRIFCYSYVKVYSGHIEVTKTAREE